MEINFILRKFVLFENLKSERSRNFDVCLYVTQLNVICLWQSERDAQLTSKVQMFEPKQEFVLYNSGNWKLYFERAQQNNPAAEETFRIYAHYYVSRNSDNKLARASVSDSKMNRLSKFQFSYNWQ